MPTKDSVGWLTEADREELARRGISIGEILRQRELLRAGRITAKLERAATVGDGIQVVGEREVRRLDERAAGAIAAGRVSHFVPASGAASRMFAELLGPDRGPAVARVAAEIESFAFGRDVIERVGAKASADALVDCAVSPSGLNLAALPKGLVPFHRYAKGTRCAAEEHLVEALAYARDAKGVARVHFTVSAEHLAAFEELVAAAAARLSSRGQLAVGFSTQHPSTDTIALDSFGEPLRDAAGALVFRPGGHGSLFRNLGELEADIVAIKNIDNVCRESSDPSMPMRCALIGLLVDAEARRNSLVRSINETALKSLMVLFGRDADDVSRWPRERTLAELNRPIRVCGVVANTGEPGGGPFHVRRSGGVRLQIVESAEVDVDSAAQRAIFAAGTHFNPVEVICALRDAEGAPYPLARFTDPSAAFIADKTHNGLAIRALEHPGLWNGQMAEWNTIFVEVPARSFNPVKTVFDLLRPAHSG